jgi:hypothetical protein
MRFVKQTFTNDVTLDYNEFVDCEISNCLVLFHGGDFTLLRTTLTNVRFGLGGPANNTLNFLRLVRAANPRLLDELLNAAPGPVSGQSVTIN